jgi:hypothetical protein
MLAKVSCAGVEGVGRPPLFEWFGVGCPSNFRLLINGTRGGLLPEGGQAPGSECKDICRVSSGCCLLSFS